MCGINGIYQFSGLKKDTGLVPRMNKVLEHRGPDAGGMYKDDLIHLGHRRLSIIDIDERSNQPFETNRYVLVFNGEIYNYRDIRAQLSGHNFETESDTEVVLAAYAKWGSLCLRSFNGMFAFAIWDKEKHELFIARDRLGIKPLYYVLTNDEIIFSSSVRAILSTDLIERKMNPDALVDYLRFQTVHAPYTLIEGVFCLMPGQQILLNEAEGAQFSNYWSITEDFNHFKGNQKAAETLVRAELGKSVRRRLVSDVPFSAFLSGGIDSSIIVGLMAEQHNNKVSTFSMVFKEDEFNEQKYARLIADKYQTNHHEIELSIQEFKDLIPTALAFIDHPSADGPNTFVISKKAREAGVKMALSGLGGDELFGGYTIFEQIRTVQRKKWLKSFPAYVRKPIGNIYHAMKREVASGKIKELIKQEYFDMEYIYQFYRQVFLDDQIRKLIHSDKLPINQSFTIAHELVGYNSPGWQLPSYSRTSVAEISTYLQNVLLRDSDQMSMAQGLEIRVPFLDHEFVEQILGIQDKYKRAVSPKKLLVDSFQDMLPKEIYNRPKMGFALPYDQWMRTELKEFCQERLDSLKEFGLFRSEQLNKLWSQFLSDDKRVTWSRIWPLVTLGDWMKTNRISE